MSTLAAAASHVQDGAYTSGNGDLIGYLRVLEIGVILGRLWGRWAALRHLLPAGALRLSSPDDRRRRTLRGAALQATTGDAGSPRRLPASPPRRGQPQFHLRPPRATAQIAHRAAQVADHNAGGSPSTRVTSASLGANRETEHVAGVVHSPIVLPGCPLGRRACGRSSFARLRPQPRLPSAWDVRTSSSSPSTGLPVQRPMPRSSSPCSR